jgi:ParB family chromosome partitioning protein
MIELEMLQERKTTLDKIKPGPQQVRQKFEAGSMSELVDSIRQHSLLNPPIVYAENGHYRLLAGERRSRAMCAIALSTDLVPLDEAIELVCRDDAWEVLGTYPILKRVEVRVRVAPEQMDRESVAVVENLQREDLTLVEEGRAYERLLKIHKSLNRVSKLCGKSQGYIKSRMDILKLDPEIMGYMESGQISKDSHVTKALLELPEETRLQLARRFAEKGASIEVIVRSVAKVKQTLDQAVVVAPPAARVAVQQAEVKRVQLPAPETIAVRCFCPACAEEIRAMAEELCGPCAANGLTARCLSCPGLIEFVESLIKRVNCDDV